jgi:pimeloyl-ACP methyl ester carboxylesterase
MERGRSRRGGAAALFRAATVLPACGLLAACILLAACATARVIPVGEIPAPLSGAAAAFARPEPGAFAVAKGERKGEYGCPVPYETYLPEPARTGTMVFLAHGFLRDLRSMRGWAARWASFGVPVTIMSLRNSTLLGGRHDRNAADILALARSLHRGPVLYAGFSAGGLAAYLASIQDPRAVAYLGLDPVDAGDLARSSGVRFGVPALLLLAEPSSCNARGNFLQAIPNGGQIAVLRVLGATHCHFEDPYDAACGVLCGSVKPPEAAAQISDTIHALATAWVLERTGVSPEAAQARDLLLLARSAAAWRNRVAVIR